MFKNISWSSYVIFILITLVVYYTTVGVLYYLSEIKQVFSGKSGLLLKLNPSKKLVTKNIIQPQADHLNEQGFTSQSESTLHPLVNECMNEIKNTLQYAANNNLVLHPLVNECMNEIKNTLQYAANNNLVRSEVIYSLQQLINNYPALEDTSFKSFITNYILIECANYCSVHLDEHELKGLWANQR